jgi:hypothetical protein
MKRLRALFIGIDYKAFHSRPQIRLDGSGIGPILRLRHQARKQVVGFMPNQRLRGKPGIDKSHPDIIGRVALLIRYGIIRMAERRRVCGRRLAETGLSVGGVCLGAF